MLQAVLHGILGLLGLGFVVFIHELGHFIFARLNKIKVEAFSIGWGHPIVKWKSKEVEYRIGILPIGGYCKMAGEDIIQEAILEDKEVFERKKGTYFGAHPLQRITVALAGPFFNVLLTFVIMFFISLIGYNYVSSGNKIVLASDVENKTFPSDEAGLMTGDRILSINGEETKSFKDIRDIINSTEGSLNLLVERDDQRKSLIITPKKNEETGSTIIGIYRWVDPVIDTVKEDSPAALADLKSGDVVTSINGVPFTKEADVNKILKSEPTKLDIEYLRQGVKKKTTLIVDYTSGNPSVGFSFALENFRTEGKSFSQSIVQSFHDTKKLIVSIFSGILSLFKGNNITESISGPIMITYFIGQAAALGFYQFFNMLAMLSVALFVMNLLPIPALDGGQILLFIVEAIKGKPLKARTVFRYQFIGAIFVFGLLILSTINDINFFY
ncbi:RIP metalloprotease RseP [Spirochaeta cellobiosiphila]|uniref:RIP metalloprotease RseP n=1 Tax=Spirochaeta cellobiosiphila TaxID=504483 RepID=UPI0004107F8F|nr:RIP metalloprotease RseP [Spirochaeta cellobiosiphila]